MKKMFDIYEHRGERHVHYGIKVRVDYKGHYIFTIYKNVVEDWYRGEDSGALYPEYSCDETIEMYDLNPILEEKIVGITIKNYIDKMLEDWPPYAGDWYTPGSLHTLYRHLDEIIDIEKLRKKVD